MSKAVLISIRPKWCEKIASGEKTVEVRKTRPKIETPFKCYIYCTAGRAGYDALWVLDAPSREKYSLTAVSAYLEKAEGASKGNCKVIGEFTCDAITRVNICGFWGDDGRQLENQIKETCLTPAEVNDYLGTKVGYGWHISDLRIYNMPRELGEFTGLRTFKSGFELRVLDRAPQSWCYVE